MKHLWIACIALLLICCKNAAKEERSAHRLIYNNDGTEILGNNWLGQRPLTLNDLYQYVDQIANSQVTTYMICSGSDFSYYRSQYGSLLGDNKNGAAGCEGNPELGKALDRYYQNILALEKENTDIVEATLKRAKEKNLEAFITYRVNDLHFADTTGNCPQQYSDFWRANPQFWTNDTALNGWNARSALDFAHPEVRNHKLNAIREQLIKYGSLLDGFELDFMRFIVYFKKHEAQKNAPLMTDLVRQARGIADSVGRALGKRILLTARVPATMNDCLAKGLDAQTWAKEGLVDFLTMGVHWRGEPVMGVADFKKELGVEIPVYATLDDGTYNPRDVYSHGMYRGMASHALAQGASGTTLFNYFLTAYNDAGKALKPEEGTVACRTIAPELLQELGSLETLRKRNKIYALSDGEREYELTPNSPLPLTVSPRADLSIFVGDDPATDKPEEVILFVRTQNQTPYSVKVNGNPVSKANSDFPQLYDRLRGLKEGQQVVAFSVPVASLKHGDNQISFASEANPVRVLRMELALKYGSPQQSGYF